MWRTLTAGLKKLHAPVTKDITEVLDYAKAAAAGKPVDLGARVRCSYYRFGDAGSMFHSKALRREVVADGPTHVCVLCAHVSRTAKVCSRCK